MKFDPHIQIDKKNIVIDKSYPASDYIIHAASMASPTYYRKFPIETIGSKCIRSKNLLDFSIKFKIKVFFFLVLVKSMEIQMKKTFQQRENIEGM